MSLDDPRSFTDFGETAKALKKLVRSKLNHHLCEFPSGLYGRLTMNCILSGSAISSIYHSEEPKDYDLWCKDRSMIDTISKEIQEKYSEHIMEYTDSYSGLAGDSTPKLKLITKNAITLKGNIQLITLGDYESQRKMFDLIHCLPYYDLQEDKFYISEHQLDVIRRKKLEKNPNGRPVADWRMGKFKLRGWDW